MISGTVVLCAGMKDEGRQPLQQQQERQEPSMLPPMMMLPQSAPICSQSAGATGMMHGIHGECYSFLHACIANAAMSLYCCLLNACMHAMLFCCAGAMPASSAPASFTSGGAAAAPMQQQWKRGNLEQIFLTSGGGGMQLEGNAAMDVGDTEWFYHVSEAAATFQKRVKANAMPSSSGHPLQPLPAASADHVAQHSQEQEQRQHHHRDADEEQAKLLMEARAQLDKERAEKRALGESGGYAAVL